jgi:tetratricopeptide (TPR) repeat protein
MASGEELETKAKELERADRHQEALDAYLRLAEEAEGDGAAVLWRRIGSIQRRTGDVDAASTSYARAVELFAAAGQKNNALALCLDLAEADAIAPPTYLTQLRLALDLGYPAVARLALTPLLLDVIHGGDSEELPRLIASFLERFGSDPRSSPGALVESLPAADEEQAVPLLLAVWSILDERAAAEMANRLRAEIVRIQPSADPRPGSGNSPTPAEGVGGETASNLPLIVPTSLAAEDSFEIAPLQGLEPTHADLDREPAEVGTADELPILEPAAGHPAERTRPSRYDLDAAGEEDQLEEDEEFEEGEPLPLLVPNDREAPFDSRSLTGKGAEYRSAMEERVESLADDISDPDIREQAPPDAVGTSPSPQLDIVAITSELDLISGREVEESDAASHYDVGVAFKEMGMIDDAIARLAAALAGGYNPLATLEVLGEILVAQGRNDVANRVLGFARTTDPASDDAMAGVLYWLARSDEALGRSSDARALFSRVVSVAPTFHDASTRLSASAASDFDTRKRQD